MKKLLMNSNAVTMAILLSILMAGKILRLYSNIKKQTAAIFYLSSMEKLISTKMSNEAADFLGNLENEEI